MALPVLALDAGGRAVAFRVPPARDARVTPPLGPALSKFVTVPDVHAQAVLERVRAAAPDLGVIYGAPILKPELFGIPPLGTLGIHHGRVPQYRGKKTTCLGNVQR